MVSSLGWATLVVDRIRETDNSAIKTGCLCHTHKQMVGSPEFLLIVPGCRGLPLLYQQVVTPIALSLIGLICHLIKFDWLVLHPWIHFIYMFRGILYAQYVGVECG